MSNKSASLSLSVAFMATWIFCFSASARAVNCRIQKDNNHSLFIPDLPPEFWSPHGAVKRVKDGLALTIDRKIVFLNSDRTVKKVFGGRCRLVYDVWSEAFFLFDDATEPRTEIKIPERGQTWALERCAGVVLKDIQAANYRVLLRVNPIDEKQEKETRKWLSSKGIGGPTSGLIGKALGAVINLKTESELDYECTP